MLRPLKGANVQGILEFLGKRAMWVVMLSAEDGGEGRIDCQKLPVHTFVSLELSQL